VSSVLKLLCENELKQIFIRFNKIYFIFKQMRFHLKFTVVFFFACIVPVEHHAQDLQKMIELGISYLDSGKYEESGNALDEFLRYDSSSTKAWIEIARFYEDQGVYDSAKYFINIAIEKYPGNVDLLSQRMFLNIVLEQYISCQEDARYILSVMPDDLTAIYCLAFSLMESGDYEESIRYIQEGIELAPELAAFYALMSRVLTRKGSFVESGMFINRAIDLAPDETGNYFIKAENVILNITNQTILLANIYPPRFRSIRSTEISRFDKNILDRKHPYYYKTLADKFSKDFRSLALDEYFMLYYGQTVSGQYVPYARNERYTADSLFSIMNRGQYAEAAVTGADYLDKNPSEISIYHHTGLAYLNSGNYSKAEEYFHKYYGFITSILASGDGKSPESAYIVISTNEEYTLMEYLGLRVSQQLLTEQKNQYFDVLTGITHSGEEKQVYFNVDKPFGSLKNK
jgi:tetratricopeptide (TPR) repeat protein